MRFRIRESLTPEQAYEILSFTVQGLIRTTTSEYIRAALIDAAKMTRERLCQGDDK